jgi:hypothetical protein
MAFDYHAAVLGLNPAPLSGPSQTLSVLRLVTTRGGTAPSAALRGDRGRQNIHKILRNI